MDIVGTSVGIVVGVLIAWYWGRCPKGPRQERSGVAASSGDDPEPEGLPARHEGLDHGERQAGR